MPQERDDPQIQEELPRIEGGGTLEYSASVIVAAVKLPSAQDEEIEDSSIFDQRKKSSNHQAIVDVGMTVQSISEQGEQRNG